jgi:hypothetical protein
MLLLLLLTLRSFLRQPFLPAHRSAPAALGNGHAVEAHRSFTVLRSFTLGAVQQTLGQQALLLPIVLFPSCNEPQCLNTRFGCIIDCDASLRAPAQLRICVVLSPVALSLQRAAKWKNATPFTRARKRASHTEGESFEKLIVVEMAQKYHETLDKKEQRWLLPPSTRAPTVFGTKCLSELRTLLSFPFDDDAVS